MVYSTQIHVYVLVSRVIYGIYSSWHLYHPQQVCCYCNKIVFVWPCIIIINGKEEGQLDTAVTVY